jgi:hypothetical protein
MVTMRRVIAAIVWPAASLLWAPSAAFADENVRNVGGFAIYLGVLPAQMVRGHGREHPEQKMHRGVPGGRGHQHIVVAVFDALSGARIGDAVVTATVTEPGFAHVEKRLEPMPIAGAMSYGNYFSMPAKGPYRVDVRVVRPTTGKTVDAMFMVTPPQ